jgi:hypothetical protein
MNAAALLSSLIPGAGQTPGAPIAGAATGGVVSAETSAAAAGFAQALAGVLAGAGAEAVTPDGATPTGEGAVPTGVAPAKAKQGHALGHQVRAEAKHAASGHKLGWTVAPGQMAKAEGQLTVDTAPTAAAATGAAVPLAANIAAPDGDPAGAPVEIVTAEASELGQAVVPPQPAPLAPTPSSIIAPSLAASAGDSTAEAASTAAAPAGVSPADAPTPVVTPDLDAAPADAPAGEGEQAGAPAQAVQPQPADYRSEAAAGKGPATGDRPALTRSTAFAENRPAEAAQEAQTKTDVAGETPRTPAAQAEGPPAHAQVPAWAAAAERIAAGQAVRKTETSKTETKESKGKAEAAAPTGGAASADTLAAPAVAKASAAPAGAAAPQAASPEAQIAVVEGAHAGEPQVEVAAADAPLQTDAPEAPPLANPVRGAPETVAHLAAQIVKKLEGRHTSFDIQLDPAGLGSVQVKMEINAQGELSAHMNFERADTAADLRSRAQELQRALEQAGFDLSRGSLSFEHGQREPGQHQADGRPARSHGRAFADALRTAEEADVLPGGPIRLQARTRMGVDVRI